MSRHRLLSLLLIATLAGALLPLQAAADPLEVAPKVAGGKIEGLPQGTAAGVSAPLLAPMPFSLLGLELPDDVDEAYVRTSVDGADWTEWVLLEFDPQEGPDADSDEWSAGVRGTEPLWVGEGRYVQVASTDADTEEIVVHLVDGAGHSRSAFGRAVDTVRAIVARGTATAHASSHPKIVSRSQWGANESWRNGEVEYAEHVRYGIVHHTATSNSYSASEAPAIVRSIYSYHANSLGWNDIGYNLLVDRFGTIYEGRWGGLDRPVIGAHAAGFNTESFGISLIGNMETGSVPTAGYNALIEAIAWKFALHDIDPKAKVQVTSRGSNKYAKDQKVWLDTLIGHRDVGKTACPGKNLYPRLGQMRDQVAARMAVTYPFSDTMGTAHEATIKLLAELGITQGCADRRFCPTIRVSRGQMATFIARAVGALPLDADFYTDVLATYTHAGMINRLTELGIASGYDDGTYRPGTVITRAEMAQFLQRALELEPLAGQRFADVPADHPAAGSINAIAEAGITVGCEPGRFCPGSGVTRAQMATFLIRAFYDG